MPEVEFNEVEQQVMDHILGALNGIRDDLKLKRINGEMVNATELVSAVHTLQSFVIQHMLQRLNPDKFGAWFDGEEG